ncbi:glycoside hydrolase family 16 protein [Aulographum hederae CBS 113979]|uniref:Glycoside hydrolase family 16 protein n=1 Tax=Aulographum hederae CBS 113979 TaxID=1176131 RepID=A0A6G1H8P9_9PEZI|nr:glycoside hydrolase family 16 protein [Aulographum hederae CBS 113979]
MRISISPPSLLILLITSLPQKAVADSSSPSGSDTRNPTCSCYRIPTTSEPLYFHHHRFWDFRSLPSSPSYSNTPPPSQGQRINSNFLSTSPFTNDWSVQDWSKNATSSTPLHMTNSPDNIFVSQISPSNSADTDPADDVPKNRASANTTALTLFTTRTPSFQSTAELQSQTSDYLHASLRLRFRVIGAGGGSNGGPDPGAVVGAFFYADDSNESDIEILTRDATSLYRFSNQPSVDKDGDAIAEAEVDVDLSALDGGSGGGNDTGDWTRFHDYRIDWSEHEVTWWVDGIQRARNSYGVPKKPAGINLNVWGDGGEWSGEMEVGGVAGMEVEWVEVVFNRTVGEGERRLGKRGDEGCRIVCRVDGVRQLGVPEVMYTAGARIGRVGLLGCEMWVVMALALLISGMVDWL